MGKPVLPTYKTIAAEITNRIHEGEYKSGSYLPSENQLAREFEVTRTTIRKALNILKERGTIESHQGKGYRVKLLHWEQSLLTFYSFGRDIAWKVQNPETRLLSYNKIRGLKNINEFINTELWEITRLRFMNEIPLILETSYIPVKVMPEFKEEDLKQNSLYNLLKENGVHIVKAKEYLEPVLPSLEDQKLLNIKQNTPLFQTLRYTYDSNEKLLEVRESLIRGDHFRFSVEMTL
ncbi:GntR family transcriptional regulator [Halothermothrix orenii]|uniref:Transcriptional regulator, GntR family n=1 Tax=Halothermothrix orenii (strain H 168 / OCM 544 / DSM 9562) TaxID=373903 RepID=B8D1T8_HALOH|nr:GntR family transcriptional regulator [Halothermothrix orenii]ACL69165.1 transcriptional regulator, GntR family [Halothermothrix orenii H 168]